MPKNPPEQKISQIGKLFEKFFPENGSYMGNFMRLRAFPNPENASLTRSTRCKKSFCIVLIPLP
jgi:hypothetical protein